MVNFVKTNFKDNRYRVSNRLCERDVCSNEL